eukprot:g5514.t1 g5514   contig2:682325-683428(+)
MATQNIDPEDPREYVAHIRTKLEEHLKLNEEEEDTQHYGIDLNVREIRAILNTNEEIFQRCMDCMSREEKQKNITVFRRIIFDNVVRTRSVKNNTTRFIVDYDYGNSTKSFDTTILEEVPGTLRKFISPVNKPFGGRQTRFVDLNALFRSALMLHDDILAHFLVRLKSHLISVQVCLGGIEEWILEPTTTTSFLESIFGDFMTYQGGQQCGKITPERCSCAEGTHDKETKCLRCGFLFGGHKKDVQYDDFGELFGPVPCRTSWTCPNSPKEYRFTCRRPVILKDYHVTGRFETKFNVAEEGQREKLKQFVAFLTPDANTEISSNCNGPECPRTSESQQLERLRRMREEQTAQLERRQLMLRTKSVDA